MSFIWHIHNYTEYNEEWNVFSAFNPSKCTHTWRSGQPTLRRPGSSWGFGSLPKGLTSVVDTSCQSRDSNPQLWVTSGFKSNGLSIRPRTAPMEVYLFFTWVGPTRSMRNIPISWCLRHHASLSSRCTVAWIQCLRVVSQTVCGP